MLVNRTINSRARSAGVTLIELMVAVAVLAVLLAVAVPSFSDFFERYRVRGASDDVMAMLAEARQASVESDRNITLRFVASASSWCAGAVQAADPVAGQLASSSPPACDCVVAANACTVGDGVLVVDGASRSGVTLLSGGGTTFTYDSKDGTLTNLALTPQVEFLSSSSRYGIRVTVSALGQARACVPAGKRPIPGFSTCI